MSLTVFKCQQYPRDSCSLQRHMVGSPSSYKTWASSPPPWSLQQLLLILLNGPISTKLIVVYTTGARCRQAAARSKPLWKMEQICVRRLPPLQMRPWVCRASPLMSHHKGVTCQIPFCDNLWILLLILTQGMSVFYGLLMLTIAINLSTCLFSCMTLYECSS